MASIQKAPDRPNWRCAFTDPNGRPQQVSTGIPVLPDSAGNPNRRNEKIANLFADGVECVVNELKQGGFTVTKLRRRVEQFAERIGFITGKRIEPKTLQEWLASWLRTAPAAQTQIVLQDADSQARRLVVDFFKTTLDQVAVAGGVDIKGCSIEQFFKEWGEAIAKAPKITSGTKRRYSEVASSFLAEIGNLKARPLEWLTAEQIQKYRDGLKKRGIAAPTINLHLKIVKIAMRWAADEDYIEKSPAKRVNFLPVSTSDRQPRRDFTVKELEATYRAANHEWQGMILFSLYCGGLRLGDVANLRESNVSERTGVFTCIEQKTRKPKRLKLEKPLLRWLDQRRARLNGDGKIVRLPGREDAPLFPSLCGKPVARLSYRFKSILIAAGLLPKRDWRKRAKGQAGPRELSPLSFHGLRHTSRTWLDRVAQNPRVVNEIMGHSEDVGKRYRHFNEDDYSKVLGALPDIVREIEEPKLLP